MEGLNKKQSCELIYYRSLFPICVGGCVMGIAFAGTLIVSVAMKLRAEDACAYNNDMVIDNGIKQDCYEESDSNYEHPEIVLAAEATLACIAGCLNCLNSCSGGSDMASYRLEDRRATALTAAKTAKKKRATEDRRLFIVLQKLEFAKLLNSRLGEDFAGHIGEEPGHILGEVTADEIMIVPLNNLMTAHHDATIKRTIYEWRRTVDDHAEVLMAEGTLLYGGSDVPDLEAQQQPPAIIPDIEAGVAEP